LGLDIKINNFGFGIMAEINGGVGFGGDTYGTTSLGFNWGYVFLAELYHTKSIGLGFGYGELRMAPAANDEIMIELGTGNHAFVAMSRWRDHYTFSYPFLRFEFLIFLKNSMPITLYTDYFFKHGAWGLGARLNFNRRK